MPISLRLSPKVTTSDTAPVSPTAGDQWWNSTDGGMYIYYDDGSVPVWVSASPPATDGTNSVVSVNSPLTYDSVNKIIGLSGTFVTNGATTPVGIGGVASATSQLVVADTVLATGTSAGSLVDLSQTWNNAAGNPTAIKLNVTNTASGATSKLMDLQVGGGSVFNITKTGQVSIPTNVGVICGTSNITDSGGAFFVSAASILILRSNGSTTVLGISYPDAILTTAGSYSWGSSGINTPDLKLYRDAANTLAQRNGVNSQTSRIYNTYTDASNYERGILSWNSNELTLGTEAGGTGTKRLLNINTPTSITGTTASDLPTYGSEFLSVPANFTLGAAWAGDNTTGFTHTSGAGNTATLTYSTLASNNTKYQIVTTVTGRTTGTYTLAFGGISFPGITSSYTIGPTSTATTGLVITPTFDFNGTIVISIKAITAVSSALVSFKDSGSVPRAEIRATAGSVTNNTFIGTNSGGYNTTGANNTGIGFQTLLNTTTGLRNTAIGLSALQANTTANDNTAIGSSALIVNTTGTQNTAIGVNALTSNTNGSSNVAIGYFALNAHTTGFNNVAIGQNALYSITGGSASNNTGVGYQAGRYIADGSTALAAANNSTYIGYNTKANAANPTNETVIGYNAIGSGSNTTTIGSLATTATKIFGVVSTAQVATTLASAATIAPTLPIHFVSGVTTIDTITPPPLITSTGGQITLIPTGIFTISTAGNIALGTITIVSKALIMTYDATTAKWYPSY